METVVLVHQDGMLFFFWGVCEGVGVFFFFLQCMQTSVFHCVP